ncbi:uncharacterized protein EI90DRAFT_3027419 [Cantharellus anzutake]|uniref:uncharacterized protein n=1 Tax=Cantharellus anzutake TaxID=1750568 RepID=UPI0019031CB9|nr:uncharacterized protein EI90DRAFT_3027419 [Cantharellus anzutake]KAF8343877.1 hypothetical protein EI90DRAFT_3027419 [Cantharellus anzutake]
MATRPPVPPPKDVVAPRLFYRLYSESESIRSRHYVTPDDHSFARINADTIPPPHTAAALRRFLCSQEGFDPERSVLFLKRSDTEPAMDAEFISVLKGVGPGSSSDQPLALIVKVDKETPAPRFRIRAKEKWIAPKGYLSYEEGEVLLTDGIDDIHQGSIRMSFLHSWVTVLTTVIGLWKAQKSRGSGRIGCK